MSTQCFRSSSRQKLYFPKDFLFLALFFLGFDQATILSGYSFQRLKRFKDHYTVNNGVLGQWGLAQSPVSWSSLLAAAHFTVMSPHWCGCPQTKKNPEDKSNSFCFEISLIAVERNLIFFHKGKNYHLPSLQSSLSMTYGTTRLFLSHTEASFH